MPVVGVDEAGRGPVLGSMFVAAVRVVDPAALPDDLDDSKSLSAETREALAAALRGDERVTIAVVEVPPARIDDPDTDMNGLTAAGHAEALAEVAADGDRAILDACDVNAERFARRVVAGVPTPLELRAEHHADSTFAVVSAASVVAKVARDDHIAALAAEHGELGSGYAGDQTTRSFLAEYVADHGELPAFARASWQTSQDALAAAEQSGLADF